MSKKSYWIADPNTGTKALVEGAEQRDHWTKVLGWTEVDEPGPADRIHLRHAETGGQMVLAREAAEGLWKGLGWEPSPPPEPVDPTKDPALVDQISQPAAAARTSSPAPAAQTATGTAQKES